ncbi:MAG: sulfite exporter TauE/SafE family protein [Spirochaetales bacterium]|nr:sulfite exporter TauE/SafE family protein [Spirochaetales bacterium]
MNHTVALAAVYAVAGVVHGLVGFGFALLSVPVVAMLFDPATAVAMNAVVGTANCAYKAWLLRSEITPRSVLSFFAVALVGIPVGVFAIGNLPRGAALTAIGVFVIVVALGNLRHRDGMRTAMRSRMSFWILAGLAGVLSGAFGAPGPAAIPYFVSRDDDPLVGSANAQLFFTLAAGPVLAFHIARGTMTVPLLGRSVVYLPIVFLAGLIGTRLSRRTPEHFLRVIVDCALIAFGAWLVVENGIIGR